MSPIPRGDGVRRVLLALACTLAVPLGLGAIHGAQTPVSSAVVSLDARAVVDQYCIACHNQRLKTGGVVLEGIDLSNISERADLWERVLKKLRMGLMPPAGRPRPDQATYDALSSWIEGEIDSAASARPNPGRTAAFHRLNRTEYSNVIRDLLELDIDVTSMFPAEPSTFGLDNIAEVLSLSPALMARYTSAARKISRLAVGLRPMAANLDTYTIAPGLSQDGRMSDALPLGSRGGMAIQHYFPVAGEYDIRIGLTGGGAVRGLREANEIDLRLDGVRIERFAVGGQPIGKPAPLGYDGNIFGDKQWEEYVHTAGDNLAVRVAMEAGRRQVSASFVERIWEPDGVMRRRRISSLHDNDIQALYKPPDIEAIYIRGPYSSTGAGDTPSRSRIFVCRPERVTDEEPCAERILGTLARRAYRRPVTNGDLETLLEFYRLGRSDGSFEDGIQFALERILVAPSFLFRVEREPANSNLNTPYPLADLELASRLSFFLWGSIPDDRLLNLAVQGRLRDPRVLEREARRLIADPRSTARVVDFLSQWLDLRLLTSLVADSKAFPDFDEHLRSALQRELELFLKSQVAEDHSVLEFLTAEYTFVNERLARHYGIPNVYGNEFRRVTITDDARVGLLGKGGILAVTSYPNRTSPVLRGKWVLANLLGSPPPEPPADVPALKDVGPTGQPASVRERLEQHRNNAVCANCHAQFDPLGLALENFDAIGAWRTEDAGVPINASFVMPGTTPLQGATGLRQFLTGHSEQVVGAVTEKLLALALGRVTETFDRPVIRKILQDAKASDYRWSSILVGVVNSTTFRMRMPSIDGAKPASRPGDAGRSGPSGAKDQ